MCVEWGWWEGEDEGCSDLRLSLDQRSVVRVNMV